jgi:hypothetical protein
LESQANRLKSQAKVLKTKFEVVSSVAVLQFVVAVGAGISVIGNLDVLQLFRKFLAWLFD